MKATKLPSGNYRCRAYNKYTGKTKSFTATTKKEAERKASLYYLSANDSLDIKVKEAIEIYIADRTSILSPATLREYRNYQRNYFELLNNRNLSSLNDSIVQHWVNTLAENHSQKTVKNIYGFLTAVTLYKMPYKRFNVSLPKLVPVDTVMPSTSDIQRLIAYLDGSKMQTVVELAIYCCMRRGEISALRNEDIHNGYISVKQNIVMSDKGWVTKAPKTFSSYRNIPCPQFLIDKLKSEGVPNIKPSGISSGWNRVRNKLGLDFRFHDLRHYSASMMLSVIPKTDVENFGGWEHGSDALNRIYTYNIKENTRSASEKWINKVEELAINLPR